MWIMSQDGFTSAVFKNKKFQLRARDRQSLERMGFKGKQIVTGVGTDYPFRVYLTKRQYKRIVCRQIDAIDYSNFKNRVAVTRGRRYSDALHDVWVAMLRVEPKNAMSLLGNSSFRTYKPGSRVAEWWPEYSTPGSTNGTDAGAWSDYDAWEARKLDRDSGLVDPQDLLIEEDLRQMEEDVKSIHDYTESEWAELMGEAP